MTTPPRTHDERLGVPLSWWLVSAAVVLPVAAALGIYLGWWQVAAFTAIAAVGLVVGLGWYGSTRLVVTDDGLRAGDWTIEWRWVGKAVPLDAAATHDRLGPRADAAAALRVRPYIPASVEVEITDPADPHPYWLLSSRRPSALAAAINAHTQQAPTTNSEEPA